eukprot:TRINITY_DN1735_c0_g1_i1.p1 TRINITY_DN1735_c0_g1~~TRINITY_DN1735_c0_g1_i1.p1  ORF type:complete len:193 (-),score=42.93 TRINITY_DN1735_c0_g1_i1:52-630(-)
MTSIKCVVTGDGTCGKTCMLVSYVSNAFPTEYVPTVFNNYTKNLLVNGKPIKLGLWDTAGQDDYDRLRPLSYNAANIVLICFAIDSIDSYNNVKNKWVAEAQQYAPQAKYLIVGTKSDLRSQPPVTYDQYGYAYEVQLIEKDQGQALAVQTGAAAYLECSALTQEGLKKVFDVAVQVGLGPKGGDTGCCAIL